jgi:predicted Zn-dependent protease
MEKAESELKYSKFLVRDESLSTYLSSVACRVGRSVCVDVRVYLTRAPYFNASMAPNGMMQIWTGLLLRVSNEAQLASVIGHEIGHYIERHSLERWRAAKSALAASNIVGMGLGVAGAGVLAQLPSIVAIASLLAYTREQEREADAIGFDLMTRAGYHPMAASEVWQSLIEESEASPDEKRRDLFTSTHPEPEERQRNLREMALELKGVSSEKGEREYMKQARAIRSRLLDDEIRLRQPERSLVVLGRLREREPNDPELAFAEAEVLRLRGAGEDLERAESLLEQASRAGAPAKAWRSLGLVQRNRGASELAAESFRRYLELDPNAPDKLLIRRYLEKEAR